MKFPFLPLKGAPRRCELCDGPVIVPKAGPVIDDSRRYRYREHDGVCPELRPVKSLPRKATSRSGTRGS